MASFVLFYCTNNNENTKSLVLEVYNKPSAMRSNWLFPKNGDQHIISELLKMSAFHLGWWKAWLFLDSLAVSLYLDSQLQIICSLECVWVCVFVWMYAWSNDNALLDKCCWCIHDIVSGRFYLAVIKKKKSCFVPQLYRGAHQWIAKVKYVGGRSLPCGQPSFQAFYFYFFTFLY